MSPRSNNGLVSIVEELNRDNSPLKLFLDLAGVGIQIISPDFKILHANSVTEKLLPTN